MLKRVNNYFLIKKLEIKKRVSKKNLDINLIDLHH